ncbi:MAG: sulfatase [Verrucomicrobiota bacterium]
MKLSRALCLLTLLLFAAPLQAAPPPNILFIMADDLGWADLAGYGADLHETPHLDRLARQGMRFTDAYAAAPVCSPTRSSIMTGKFPARLHITIWYEGALQRPQNRALIPPQPTANLPHSEITIAEALKAAGYFTAHVGKWHLGDAAFYPETQGFDVNIGGTFWGAPSTFFYPYRGKWGNTEEVRYVPHLEFGKDGEFLTDRLTDEAMNVIDRAADRPFFLNLWYHNPHTPIEAKPALVEHYQKKLKPGLNHQNAAYAAMIHSLDENIGRLMAKLEQKGLADRTVVIFTSDNGGFINDYKGAKVTSNAPLRSGKGSLYEGGLRVPLLIRWPGVVKPGAECRAPVVSHDFYPTLLELAGTKGDARHNQSVDGLSLVPLLKNPRATLARDTLYFHYPHYYPTTSPVSALRSGDWKLLEYHEDQRLELFNLKNDLGEATNLAARQPDQAQVLRAKLHAWRQAVGAQMPEPNPDFKSKQGKKK